MHPPSVYWYSRHTWLDLWLASRTAAVFFPSYFSGQMSYPTQSRKWQQINSKHIENFYWLNTIYSIQTFRACYKSTLKLVTQKINTDPYVYLNNFVFLLLYSFFAWSLLFLGRHAPLNLGRSFSNYSQSNEILNCKMESSSGGDAGIFEITDFTNATPWER